MRAPRQHIFLIITFLAFLFSAYAENEVVEEGDEIPENMKPLVSFVEYLVNAYKGKQVQEQEQQHPMKAFFPILKRLLISLTDTKEEAEELQANITKTIALQEKREDILGEMEQVADAFDAVDAPEKKKLLRGEMERRVQQLKKSIIDSLVLILKTAGIKPSDAEKIIEENLPLYQFFKNFEVFLMSRFNSEN